MTVIITVITTIIFMIIIIHFSYFAAVQLVLRSVWVSLTKRLLLTVMPNIFRLYGMYQ
jgi:ABC-type uncharacterized transport system involved in gliding motility auxiliary subunit